MQEWFNVVLRKAAVPLKPREATSLYRALDLHRDHSFSWWDSLIVSAAIQGGCNQLLSEDLQHGREVSGVRILNPFR